MSLHNSAMNLEIGPVTAALVVEDDPDINRLVRAKLTASGYTVEAAYDGEQALMRMEMQPLPDLIFLDLAMPGINGLEVLSYIRTHKLDMAVILMTAVGSEKVATEALRAGADDYLRKPFEVSEFQSVLERTVRSLEINRQNTVLRRELDNKHRQLELELARAAKVQEDLLPKGSPRLPGFDLAARCLPALEVGGDFFDWQIITPGVMSLAFGDVAGKGMSAALFMATVRSAIRTVVRHKSPAAVVADVATALDEDLTRSERLVTLFLAKLDVATQCLTYVDAGHGHVFVRRANGIIDALPAGGLPLGILSPQPYSEGTLTLYAGDTLIVYSDGVMNTRTERTLDPPILAAQVEDGMSALDIVNRILALVISKESLKDDMSILALRCVTAEPVLQEVTPRDVSTIRCRIRKGHEYHNDVITSPKTS